MRQELINSYFIQSVSAKKHLLQSVCFVLLIAFLTSISPAHAYLPTHTDATASTPLDLTLPRLGQKATFAKRGFLQGVKAFNDKDFYRAERILLPLAQGGYRKAQFMLGVLYESASNDRYKAVHWYLRAAEQGDANAQHSIGLAYARGLGVKKNVPKAIKWWQAAGFKGNSDSQYNLGIIYATGSKGVKQDYIKAKHWWLMAASSGDALAQYNLGAMYANGVAGQQSYCEAARWWLKSQSNGFNQANIALKNLQNRLNKLNCH